MKKFSKTKSKIPEKNSKSVRSERIDSYIQKLPPFSRNICIKLRSIIRKTGKNIIEDWKWGPNFSSNGMVCGFFATKKHVSFTFYKGALLKDPHNILIHGTTNLHNRMVKFTSRAEINKKILTGYIRKAVLLNQKGIKTGKYSLEIPVPDYLKKTLGKNPEAWENFSKFAYTYKKEYVRWVRDAKRPETRNKRLKKSLRLISAGKKMHEK